MMLRSPLRLICPVLSLIALVNSYASAQARVETIIFDGDPSPVSFIPLGSADMKELAPDMNLLPGDLVFTSAQGTTVVFMCPPDGGSTFAIESPFRVQVSVPTEASCHLDLDAGSMDVLAEASTEITSGGVDAGSVTTQYAVRVAATEEGVVQEINVFDGEVFVRSEAGELEIGQGSSLTYGSGSSGPVVEANSAEDIKRSAAVYSAYDVDQALRAGADVGDWRELRARLEELHYEVLDEPDDETRRVELARVQLRYEARDQALYNLKRADVTTEDKLRQYDIDPGVFQRGLAPGATPGGGISDANRRFLEDRRLIDSEAVVSQIEAYEPARRTIDMDMRLIDAQKLTEAMEGLEHRVRTGEATSRDYFALSKIHLEQGDTQRSAAYADRALTMYRRDRKLSNVELAELRQILEKLRGAPPP